MITRDDVAALRDKYQRMRRLRDANDAAREEGRPHLPDREELRALARAFPGALAEIDRIAPALLAERIAILDALLEREEHAADALPTWVRGWILVHRGLRGVLAIKLRLAGARTVDERLRARIAGELVDEEARAWLDRIDVIANPPAGRVVELVHREVADQVGVPAASLRTLLMPRP